MLTASALTRSSACSPVAGWRRVPRAAAGARPRGSAQAARLRRRRPRAARSASCARRGWRPRSITRTSSRCSTSSRTAACRTSRWSTSAAARCARSSDSSALPQIFSVIEGMLAGLAHAEEHGIAHRDLKPENVLITTRGGVKIADFGIARAYNAVTGAAHGHRERRSARPRTWRPSRRTNDRSARTRTSTRSASSPTSCSPGARRSSVRRRWRCCIATCTSPRRRWPSVAPDVPPPRARMGRVAAQRRRRTSARASATQAWEALEEIAVAGLGPYWRRGRGASHRSRHRRSSRSGRPGHGSHSPATADSPDEPAARYPSGAAGAGRRLRPSGSSPRPLPRSGSSPRALATKTEPRREQPARHAHGDAIRLRRRRQAGAGARHAGGGGAEDREAERACIGPEWAHPEAAAPTDHAVGRWPAWPVRQHAAVRQRSRERRF